MNIGIIKIVTIVGKSARKLLEVIGVGNVILPA
jgi:hypothetical protein